MTRLIRTVSSTFHRANSNVGLCMTVFGLVQEIADLQEAARIRDSRLGECSRQAELDQQQIDDLERQLLMQVSQALCNWPHQPARNLAGSFKGKVKDCVSPEAAACARISCMRNCDVLSQLSLSQGQAQGRPGVLAQGLGAQVVAVHCPSFDRSCSLQCCDTYTDTCSKLFMHADRCISHLCNKNICLLPGFTTHAVYQHYSSHAISPAN